MTAEGELARLRNTRPVQPLPSIESVVGVAGRWSRMLQKADTPAQRDVLSALLDFAVPVRVGYGRYRAEIHWTPDGSALLQVAVAVATHSAA